MREDDVRFVLIVGDDEEQILKYDKTKAILKDVCLNFDNSPSVGAIYDVWTPEVKGLVDEVRSNGMKAGVYGSLLKAQGFMFKALAISEDGTIGEPQLIDMGGR